MILLDLDNNVSRLPLACVMVSYSIAWCFFLLGLWLLVCEHCCSEDVPGGYSYSVTLQAR